MFRSPIFNYSGKPIYPIRRWGGVERAARQASASLLHQSLSGDTLNLSGSSSDSPRKSRWQGFKHFFSNLFNGFSSCRSSSEVSGGSRESEENINETGGTNTVASEIQERSESTETSQKGQNTPVKEHQVETESTPALKKTETSVVREKLVASPSAEPREQSIELKEETPETASVEQLEEDAIDDTGDEVVQENYSALDSSEMQKFNNTVQALYAKAINDQAITPHDIDSLFGFYRNGVLCSGDIIRHFAYVLCVASRADLFDTEDKQEKLKECITDIMAYCQDKEGNISNGYQQVVGNVLDAATSAGVFKTDEELNTLRGYIANIMAGCQDEKGDIINGYQQVVCNVLCAAIRAGVFKTDDDELNTLRGYIAKFMDGCQENSNIKKDCLMDVCYVLDTAIKTGVFKTDKELNTLKGYMEKVKSVICDASVQIDEELKKQILDDYTIIINKLLSFYVNLKASEPLSVEQPLEEPKVQLVVQEVPIEESQVETEPTSVSEPEVQSVVQEKLAEKPKEAQNTKIIDKTKSTSSQKKHVEEPQPCFQTNKEIEIFTSDELNYNTINNPNINHPLKEIIKKTSNEQVSANKPESDEENHNPELQVNLKQIEKNNNSNDDAQLKEIEQSLKSSEPLSVEQPLEEPVAQLVVQEVPVEEPPVEAKSISVPNPETQGITPKSLCKMVESSSLPNNLKDSLNSEPINVEAIKDIISAVGTETLQKEHNLVCSILKFLINKGIDSNQIFRFKDLIDHLIKNSVLTPNDHSIVFDALNILGNNSDTQSWRLAAIAIEKKLLTGEEQRTYCTTTVESIMGSNNFQSSILKMLFFNGSQERINLKNNILSSIINHEKLSDQQLRCIVQQVDKVILEAIDNDAINDISNFIAKDGILTKLLDRINDKKPKDTAIINNFANILYNIMLWMTTKKDEYSDDIGSLKESLKDLLLTFKPTLESYNSRACGMTMSDETQDPLWTYVLAMEAQNIGIDMSQSVEEPPVEAKSTSVSEAEAQGITYDALCEMVESSSLPNNLKDSLNRESINVKDIKEIISAFAPETLKEEHNLMCSLLKFLMNKVIDAGQRLEFRGLIKTLIDKEVLQKQDHNLVYESLVDISNQIQSTDSSVIIKIANSAIQQSILNQEECVGIISNSVMNAKFYDRIIANIASQNTILSHVIAKNVIQQISPEKLYNVISTVGDNLKNINDIRNTDKKASVTNWFVTEFLPTLLQRIQTLVANNSVNEEVKKNILFQFSCLFDGAILNNLFAQNKSAAAKLFNSLVPYLNQYQLNASQTQSWIDHLKEEAEKYGITLQETM